MKNSKKPIISTIGYQIYKLASEHKTLPEIKEILFIKHNLDYSESEIKDLLDDIRETTEFNIHANNLAGNRGFIYKQVYEGKSKNEILKTINSNSEKKYNKKQLEKSFFNNNGIRKDYLKVKRKTNIKHSFEEYWDIIEEDARNGKTQLEAVIHLKRVVEEYRNIPDKKLVGRLTRFMSQIKKKKWCSIKEEKNIEKVSKPENEVGTKLYERITLTNSKTNKSRNINVTIIDAINDCDYESAEKLIGIAKKYNNLI